MQHLRGLVLIYLIAAVPLSKQALEHNFLTNDFDLSNGCISTLLAEIYQQSPYNTIVLMISRLEEELRLHTIQTNLPRIIITKSHTWNLKQRFNSEIISVIVMPRRWDHKFFKSLVQTLDFMRQTKILIIAQWNETSLGSYFKENVLSISQQFRMTKIFLAFIPRKEGKIKYLYNLNPYPRYHWVLRTHFLEPFYPQHWRNMHRKSIIIFVEQTMPRVFLFLDGQGKLQMNGPWARLILLFAERFNASLHMYKSPVLDKSTFYTRIAELMEQNLIDIPITTDDGHDGKFHLNSAPIEVTQIKLMVPCPVPINTGKLYAMVLNFEFLCIIFISSLVFSIMHSLIDWLFARSFDFWSFVLNDKALPSVLGQSFIASKSPNLSLKLLYLLMFINGLGISIQFAVRIRMLFTTPPYHKPVDNYDELNLSPVQILATNDIYSEPPYPLKNVMLTNNNSFFQEVRRNFNTSYGYYTTSSVWPMFKRQQQGLTDKIFCLYDNLTIRSTYSFAIRLQKDSEYKEPLDYLIHRIHDLGLMDAWRMTTFSDMLRTKDISLLRPKAVNNGPTTLLVGDLYSLWTIAATGWAISGVVFLIELALGHRRKNLKKLLNNLKEYTFS
uniref:Ionotropic glutamate receptor C-terminal domain-containing protein n=1 Tax=Stomoxys calcitrans TaxID=35570 RepID=A0A2Y9D4R0_STOCA